MVWTYPRWLVGYFNGFLRRVRDFDDQGIFKNITGANSNGNYKKRN